MFPLAAVSSGLSVLGGLKGLVGGASAEKRAREAFEAGLRELRAAGEQEYSDALSAGGRGLSSLTGRLNDSLESTGRGLGAALAGAGVYNSSATAGALANQGAANAQALGDYSANLTDTLSRIKNDNARDVARYRLGFAGNELNAAREQQAGTAGGIASLLGSLGQFNLMQKGVPNANKVGDAGVGMRNSVLDKVQMPLAPLTQGIQYTGSPGLSVGLFGPKKRLTLSNAGSFGF